MIASDAIHKVDQSSEQTTESSSGGSRREEQGNSQVDFVPLVPLSKVERDTGKETSFGDTEEKTGDEESVEVLDETHSDHDNTPCNHDGRNPH